jgi:hypothetical protein
MSLSVIHSYGATTINMPRGFELVTMTCHGFELVTMPFHGLGIRRLFWLRIRSHSGKAVRSPRATWARLARNRDI